MRGRWCGSRGYSERFASWLRMPILRRHAGPEPASSRASPCASVPFPEAAGPSTAMIMDAEEPHLMGVGQAASEPFQGLLGAMRQTAGRAPANPVFLRLTGANFPPNRTNPSGRPARTNPRSGAADEFRRTPYQATRPAARADPASARHGFPRSHGPTEHEVDGPWLTHRYRRCSGFSSR